MDTHAYISTFQRGLGTGIGANVNSYAVACVSNNVSNILGKEYPQMFFLFYFI